MKAVLCSRTEAANVHSREQTRNKRDAVHSRIALETAYSRARHCSWPARVQLAGCQLRKPPHDLYNCEPTLSHAMCPHHKWSNDNRLDIHG